MTERAGIRNVDSKEIPSAMTAQGPRKRSCCDGVRYPHTITAVSFLLPRLPESASHYDDHLCGNLARGSSQAFLDIPPIASPACPGLAPGKSPVDLPNCRLKLRETHPNTSAIPQANEDRFHISRGLPRWVTSPPPASCPAVLCPGTRYAWADVIRVDLRIYLKVYRILSHSTFRPLLQPHLKSELRDGVS